MSPLMSTIIIGGGLIGSGFLLGRTHWSNIGATRILNELFHNKLCDPVAVIKHLQSAGAKIKQNVPGDS